MASLISDSVASALRVNVGDFFDTFSRPIVVYKTAIQNVSAISQTLAGYGDTSAETSITYTPVSGTFFAKIRHGKDVGGPIGDTKILLAGLESRILVERDCRDYINNGKTDSIIVDGLTFNTIKDESPKNFRGKTYFAFIISRTD